MTIFSVTTKYPENDSVLKDKITTTFASSYEIGRGHWLVAFTGTSKELYQKLFPGDKTPPDLPKTDVVVFSIAGYWGHASQDMWEWLRTKSGA